MGEREDHVNSQDPSDIQADIERTRGNMTETVDEIQHRISPGHIREEATQRVRDATVGRVDHVRGSMRETGMSMLDRMKQNPLPVALIGAGIGWLYMSGGDSSQRQTQSQHPSDASTSDARQRVQHAGSAAAERTQELGSEMRERTEQMGSEVRGQTQNMRAQAGQMFQSNPLAVGALAFGIGAATGLWIPETRKEHQVMGEQRDQLVDQAKGTAHEKIGQAEEVAERTFDEARQTAEEEAQKRGLSE